MAPRASDPLRLPRSSEEPGRHPAAVVCTSQYPPQRRPARKLIAGSSFDRSANEPHSLHLVALPVVLRSPPNSRPGAYNLLRRAHATPPFSCRIHCRLNPRCSRRDRWSGFDYRGLRSRGHHNRTPRVLSVAPLQPIERSTVKDHRELLRQCGHPGPRASGHGPRWRFQARHWPRDTRLLPPHPVFFHRSPRHA